MLDHYTRDELSYKLKVHPRTLDDLSRLGAGFKLIPYRRGTKMTGYVIRKDDVYRWMDEIRRDNSAMFVLTRRTPSITFERLMEDRRKWIEDKALVRQMMKPHAQRYYGRMLEDGKKKNER